MPAGAVAAAFELGEPTRDLIYSARGELGRVFRLETERGAWAVKELFLPDDPRAIDANAAFQDAVREAGVAMPGIVRASDGSVVVDLDGVSVRVYEWVELDRTGRAADPVIAATRLGLIHRIRWPAAGPPHPWYVEAVGEVGWDGLIEEIRALRPAWADGLLGLIPELRACEPIVAAARAGPALEGLCWCHLDYNTDNVLVDAAGDVVVLDWENAGPLNPRAEFASLLYELPGPVSEMRGAYEAAGGPPIGDLHAEDFAMAIAVQGHLAEFYARRGMTSDVTEDRERSAWRIGAMVARPLTRALIEQLIDEIR